MKNKKSFLLILFIAFTLSALGQQASQDHKILFEKAKFTMETKGDLKAAITLFGDLIKKYPKEREYAAKSQLYIGECYEKLGNAQARAAYERVVRDYADQTEIVTLAKAKITLSDNLSLRATPEAEQSLKLAADLFKQLKYEAAVAEYEKAIKLAPKSQLAQEAQLWIGHCYFKLGKNDLALKSFNAIVKENPRSNLVPVAELMISQVKQSIAKERPKSSVVVLDDKTILDSVTGIKYTKINSWAGKNDVVKVASSIADIIPNRKFLLAENKVIPFENAEPFTLNDSLFTFSKLSPDGTKVAFLGKNSVSVIPVSPINGRSTGPAQKILDITYQYGYDINWSPDGNNLIFPLRKDSKNSIWTFSAVDHSLKQFTDPSNLLVINNAVYSKNGLSFLYKQYVGEGFNIKMKSIEGKSVLILDSCALGVNHFVLSPDNKWILYNKIGDKKMLYRMSDKQEMELSTPKEVGDFVSWSDKENKAFSFFSSSVDNNTVKVASVFGGPVFELDKLKEGNVVGWAKNSGSLLVCENGANGKYHLKIVNFMNHDTISLDEIDNIYGFPSLSPDGSMVVTRLKSQGKIDLSIIPVSLKDGKITGKPIPIFKNFAGNSSYDFSLSPDGKSVAACNQGEVYICSVEGGTPTQLTKTPEIEIIPSWSPDGNEISVLLRSTGQLRILKATNGEVLMTQEKVETYCWTPEGKEILIAFKDGQLNAISITTGKSRKIANWKEMSPSIGLLTAIYSPDGKKIVVNGYLYAPDLKSHIFLINVADGKKVELAANYDEYIESTKWSPDSKWISYDSYGTKRDRLESTLWEADLNDFMKKMKPGTEKGFTTDFDFKAFSLPVGGVPPDGTFTDSRDGHVYKIKKIGTQTWMTENLAYLPEVSPDSAKSLVEKGYHVYGYKGYDVKEAKNTENYQKYGVLYNLPAALNGAKAGNSAPIGVQGICPKGWHLPSDTEWMILEKNLGMSEEDLKKEGSLKRLSGSVGKKLKSQEGWDDDIFNGQSGFNALPGGQLYNGVGFGFNSYAYFWTSPIFNDNKEIVRTISPTSGVYRWPNVYQPRATSIRCVKD
ncbi:MAG: FISUMP domain-containing protein [Prolixibacteraceae bacterium]